MINPPSFAFPLDTVAVTIGDRVWQILCLQSRDLIAATRQREQRDLYGFILWESAIALSMWLDKSPTLVRNKQILELGAGVGLTGLVAQGAGGAVTQTDYQLDSLTLCQWNAQQNQVTTEILQADWRRWQHTTRYDLILAADILYEEALHYYIERILHRNLTPAGKVLLADPGRAQAWAFVVHLEEHGWQVEIHTQAVVAQQGGDANPLTPSNDGTVVVTLYEAWRR